MLLEGFYDWKLFQAAIKIQCSEKLLTVLEEIEPCVDPT
jgi:hypothetical protein